MKISPYSLLLTMCALSVLSVRVKADTTLVAEGRSTFSIVQSEKAPVSLQEAALELQRDIEIATKVKLPLQRDSEKISGPFISLGATKQAAAAGVTSKGIADEGFRILTKDGNVFIIGPDTAAQVSSSRDILLYDTVKPQPDIPGPQFTKDGGFSNGTANGIYTFLEDYLDVRWLLPGDLGRDVPARSTLAIPDLNRIGAPGFIWRIMPFMQNTQAVAEWRDHLKLGTSYNLDFNHNWVQTVPPELYKDHPEWFAMKDGKRPPPPTSGSRRNRYKLETTNPELVRFFADKAIAAMKSSPRPTTFSLSASDSRGWSESPESKALYDPIPPGGDAPSVTPLILKWYRDVSEIVAKEYPQGKLAGYLYQDAGYPPTKGGMTLPDNFIPVITGKDQGYSFYREDNRKLGAYLMDAWSKVAPPTWFYFSFGTWQRSGNGMPTPLSADNLNYTFSLLNRNHITGAFLYGTRSWSQAALKNYVQAKMLWNPQLDANKLQTEWLHRAYGLQAGAVMDEFYQKLDGFYADYYQKNESARHVTRESQFKVAYGPHYPELEKIFLQAKAQPMTTPQKERLGLIEKNMIVLQWRLENAGYLPKEFTPALKRPDQEVVDLLLADQKDYDIFPDVLASGPTLKPVEIKLGKPATVPVKAEAVPNANYILLYATRDGEVRLQPHDVHPNSTFLSYRVYYESNGRNKTVQSGIMYDDAPIAFQAKANTPYYFFTGTTGIDSLPEASWEVTIPQAAPATAVFQNGVLHLQGREAPLYVYVPEGIPLTAHPAADSVTIRPRTEREELNKIALKVYPQAKAVLDFNSDWRFITDPEKSGVKAGFIKPDFKDDAWKTISATDWWQRQGYNAYLGTAWYRKTFVAPAAIGEQLAILFFGAVDGDATVYLNGKKVGEHLLKDNGEGWDQPFGIDVTAALKPGQNSIVVQVTKTNNMGGIHKGASLLMMEDTGAF